ncbi:MAG: hypothetical protein QOI03_2503, partial [Solirubrobacteraceae bacterium]|nr:hypothetical protein [Solirubrobacteraceae bacterium]
LGDPPDCGVKKARTEGSAWPNSAGILFRPAQEALDDDCNEAR